MLVGRWLPLKLAIGTSGWPPNCHTMPRYFFHLENGGRIEDKRGHNLPDDSAARREAEGIAAALLRSRGRVWSVVVTNEWGHDVIEIPGTGRV
jgi:hypothetical protein